MKHIIVTISNGTAIIRGSLVAQKRNCYTVQVDTDGSVLNLWRPHWKLKSVEPTYKKLDENYELV